MKKFIPYIVSFFLLFFVSILYVLAQQITGTAGVMLNDWEFRSDGSWNAWEVILSSIYLTTNNISGDFFMQTVWTWTFDPGTYIEHTWVGDPDTDCWYVVGSATSVNAWVIEFLVPDRSLRFHPPTGRLEWYWWNDGVGRVPFWENNICTFAIPNFSWRVKVIGNIWWENSIFSTIYDTRETQFDIRIFNGVVQDIRRNISRLIRNVQTERLNPGFTTQNKLLNALVFNNETSDMRHIRISDLEATLFDGETQGLIVIWGDVIVDMDIINSGRSPMGIISLQNSHWIWGNIYIHWNVKRIQSSIFSEWSVFSWDNASSIYNDTIPKLATLPESQLYIQWTVISKNTIWWRGYWRCPYSANCTDEEAIRYDFDYFRNFNPSSPFNRSYVNDEWITDSRYDAYSVIIEYDPRILTIPPPGFE